MRAAAHIVTALLLVGAANAFLPGPAFPAFGAQRQQAAILWPQITAGIRNGDDVLAMKCEVSRDGLTVTDTAWDTYKVAGCAKRWTLNMGLPMEVPLKNFRFKPEYSGLPVNLTVEFYHPAKPWEVKESYQEIILLGGKQRIGLPGWFHIPTGRLGYDFDEGRWFPSGWSLPRGKYGLWQGAAKARQQDRHGQSPMYDFGFTHVSPIAMTHGGSQGTRSGRAHLFTDNEWIAYNGSTSSFTVDPTHTESWQIEPFFHYADSCAIITPDFEAPASYAWGDSQYDAFAKLIGQVRAHRRDILIGCWGVGVIKSSFRIFDGIADGKPTGSVSLDSARQWRDKYNHPFDDLSPVFTRCYLNFGNPSVYWINNSKPSQLYAFVQEWEEGKLARPDVPNVLSTWIQVEFVDDYPLSQYRFTDATRKTRIEGIKHQVPASAVYALSLFGHCVMDGLQCWDVGTFYSEDLRDYSNWRASEPAIKRTVNGVDTPLNYYLKYFGFYNYHVLGMWQASRNKDIIESETKWEMPEVCGLTDGVWHVGEERYPSYANYYKQPLVRTKLSGDGKTLLVVACNPYNTGVEQVRIRRSGQPEEFRFQLVGDWPIIQRFRVAESR